MKKLILLLIIGSVFGQNLPTQPEIEKMTIAEKKLLYTLNKKHPNLTVLLEFILPTAGYIYADKKNWETGILHRIVELTAIDLAYKYDNTDSPNAFFNSKITIGVAIFIHLYELYNVKKITNDYNNNLSRKIFGEAQAELSFNLQPTYQGANLTMSYAFK